jgi:hypothetical protein
MRDQWCALLTAAGISHWKEVVVPLGCGRGQTNALERPADILLLRWDKGQDLAIDVVVSNPLTLSAHPLVPEKGRRHLKETEAAKRAKEGQQCSNAGWGFQPIAYSPWGGQGPGARALLWETLRRATADLQGWAKNERHRALTQSMSVTLAKEVGRQLSLRCKVMDICRDQADVCRVDESPAESGR